MILPVFAALLSLLSGTDEAVQLKPMTSGAMKRIGYYRPQRVTLSAEKPAEVTKVPAEFTSPLYGKLPGGGGFTLFIINEPEGKPATLIVDLNANGDLTDDAEAEWTGKPSKTPDGKEFTMYMGGATVELGAKDKPFPAHISMYRFDKNDPSRAQLKDVVLMYRDYGLEGKVTLGGKTYDAMLTDEAVAGDFRGKKPAVPEEDSGVMLFLDVNGNGKFDSKGESFDIAKPFNIAGTTYEIADMTRDGGSFKVVKSDKKVDEISTPPDLSIGKKILSFAAKDMDGKSISFPADYKGKIVLLDFWATWCGPCMREVPTVVAAFEKYHDKGFEILGISLDQKDSAEKIKKVTGDKRMTWPQIYDGGFWKAEIAQKFAIDSIPATFLVDGDTGKILAVGPRGDELAAEIEKALAARKK